MEPQDKDRLHTKTILKLTTLTLLLLSLPLLAMIFRVPVYDPGNPNVEYITWGYVDFIVMGALIFGTGLAYEVVKTKVGGAANRIVLAVVLLLAFCLIWAELAVGIFGTPFAGS